jgi:hypothetical protein
MVKPALVCLALCVCVLTRAAYGSGSPPVDIETRARGAQRAIVATVVDVYSVFHTNSFGDQLIVSRVLLHIDEVLKGDDREKTAILNLEGGTVGDLTMHVSDLPTLSTQERAVFFLDQTPTGEAIPHRRGLGILKLDESDRIPGTTLTLGSIRRMAQSVRR